MHIQKVHLQNIRSFENLEIDFGNSGAGWHVILGTNGTGKSTLIRSIALALVGARKAQTLASSLWLRFNKTTSSILLELTVDKHIETYSINIKKEPDFISLEEGIESSVRRPQRFSVAYGPFRRIGNNPNYNTDIWEDNTKLAAHISCFKEDIPLDQSIKWLINLYINGNYKGLNEISEPNQNYLTRQRGNYIFLLNSIQQFINSSSLLPNKIILSSITHEDILFRDQNNIEVSISELSDGYRSILSLVLEIIRQVNIFHSYNRNLESFFTTHNENLIIKTTGVVLIDEIDAHLHPTWQAKIGEWFTKHFPNIQFIVTTHSPIICRSADTGTIWKLSNEGFSTQIEQIEGIEKKQLVYGSILDAFETDLFGKNISRSEESKEILKEMAVLNVKQQVGRISEAEKIRLEELEQIFPIDAQDNFLDD